MRMSRPPAEGGKWQARDRSAEPTSARPRQLQTSLSQTVIHVTAMPSKEAIASSAGTKTTPPQPQLLCVGWESSFAGMP